MDFTINKGTEKSSYSLGASHLDQYGIVGAGKSNFKRTTLKFNFSTEILKNLKLTTSSIFTNTKRKSLSENALGSVLFNALNMPATTAVKDDLGAYSLAPTTGVGIEVINPIAQTEKHI